MGGVGKNVGGQDVSTAMENSSTGKEHSVSGYEFLAATKTEGQLWAVMVVGGRRKKLLATVIFTCWSQNETR